MKKILISLLSLCLCLSAVLSFGGCKSENETKNPTQSSEDTASYDAFAVTDTQTNYVKMTVKGFGDMILELYPETAPTSVANFQKLVGEKFYDGLTFHRIVSGFMIQGGAPTNGQSPATIKGEFLENGFANNLSHTRGVLSMARSSAPNSASSQFFIMHKTNTSLDGRYAAFGKLIAGYAVLDQIASVKTEYNSSGENSSPVDTIVIQSVVFVAPVN